MKKEYLIYKLSEDLKEATRIENELFRKFDVKRGLRNEDGTGVLVGLTKIGNVVGYERIPGGGLKPIPGKLFYRGYDVDDLAHAIIKEKRFGFEEIAYLLLSGRLPDKEELSSFRELINDNMPLEQKTKMNIIELEGNNIMNILARSVLEMYRFDPDADDTSRDNLMRQSIELISKFPTIIAYAYNMLRHATHGRSLHIRHPQENLSIAENFLYMLKKDYTELDARTLDLLLVLQAEHGGGNNSTFTVRVTSSTGTDTYSSIAAGIGSLKGPLHGGANIQVADMFHHLQENIQDWTNVDEIDTYFTRMLNKEAYNKTGLIYGIGHAVYTISDPRAILLKELARDLAREKGKEREFAFLELLEERAIDVFGRVKNNGKTVSSNVDFYSGFVYEMIGLPQEEDADIDEMTEMVRRIRKKMDEAGNKGDLIISVNAFVPKPFTPFQWSPLCNTKILKKRFKMLETAFKKEKHIKLLTESLKETVLQAALARGNRKTGQFLLQAFTEGIPLKQALKNSGLDIEKLAGAEYEPGCPLPWKHLDMGFKEAYLIKEWENAKAQRFTPMCFDGCKRCGVCEE